MSGKRRQLLIPATRIQHILQKNKLLTVVIGTRESSDEPSIYEIELQAISQETRDKQAKLEQLQDTIAKVTEEENQVREGLKQFIIEAKQEHGSLEDRLVTLDERYQALASLEIELMGIRRRKNIIAHEKTVKIASTENLS